MQEIKLIVTLELIIVQEMTELIFFFIGGLVAGIAVFYILDRRKKQRIISQNSVILIERVKQVLKLVTVEGDFSEIVTYKDVKNTLLDLYKAEKKALITVSARAMVGFDLAKVVIEKDDRTRTITLSSFPDPELFSIDTNIEYYHTVNNLLNRFVPEDHSRILQSARESIKDKIPESGLYTLAFDKAKQLMMGLQQIAERLHWNLKYDSLLELPSEKS